MSYSPFVMKIKFYTPQGKNPIKNAAHVTYIGTRQGADKGEIEIGDNDSELLNKPEGHIKYAAERPGSHGLFGPDFSVPGLQETRDELSSHQGIVWRAILSLQEEDAKRLGFLTRESWENTIRQCAPEMAHALKIDTQNLRWVAAFHSAEGHPHVHLVFWEKQPQRQKGVLVSGERQDLKKILVRSIFAQERLQLTVEKSALRDMIRDLAKGDVSQVLSLAREVKRARLSAEAKITATPGLPPYLSTVTQENLISKLQSIAEILPGHGRLGLQYMAPEIKNQIRETAEWLMRQPGYIQSVEGFVKSAQTLAGHYSITPESLQRAGERAYNDLRDRVGQVILKASAQLNRDPKGGKPLLLSNSVWRSAWRGIEKERLKSEALADYKKKQETRKQQIQNAKQQGARVVVPEDDRER